MIFTPKPQPKINIQKWQMKSKSARLSVILFFVPTADGLPVTELNVREYVSQTMIIRFVEKQKVPLSKADSWELNPNDLEICRSARLAPLRYVNRLESTAKSVLWY